MKKQSSIDYLIEKLEGIIIEGNQLVLEIIIDHAKEMHKQEIQRAFLKNDNSVSIDYAIERFEKYYNETFKNK